MKYTVKNNISTNNSKLAVNTRNPVARRIPRKKKKTYNPRIQRGVVYLSHLPHGFYEEQLDKYFSQFGTVTNICVPRSKTGRSKGYAFIEFKHAEVAEMAAFTMDNYPMFNRLLKAKYLPPNQQKPHLFRFSNRSNVKKTSVSEKAQQSLNDNRIKKNRRLDLATEVAVLKSLSRKKKELEARLKNLDVNYKFDVKKSNVVLLEDINS
uniref:RRM domain-containing protein n=1 Tax=Homalodisca liturata TaxID=320908 RepID=A0A1B6HGQ1_9HEMI